MTPAPERNRVRRFTDKSLPGDDTERFCGRLTAPRQGERGRRRGTKRLVREPGARRSGRSARHRPQRPGGTEPPPAPGPRRRSGPERAGLGLGAPLWEAEQGMCLMALNCTYKSWGDHSRVIYVVTIYNSLRSKQ